MANFSDFFPAAGGGGGFTKMNKYSTNRAYNDATHKLGESVTVHREYGGASGTNTFTGNQQTSGNFNAADSYVGLTFVWNSTTHTITASTANSGAYSTVIWTFTPALTASISTYNQQIDFVASPSFTVNPATDLGLEDGASLGYMLVGAGYIGSANGKSGGRGGKIIYGTKIITDASTDLILTPGVANGGNSTTSGGLTLSSGDGSHSAGFPDYNSTNTVVFTEGSGINGYGVGGGVYDGTRYSGTGHGWGLGSYGAGSGGDGAILLYY